MVYDVCDKNDSGVVGLPLCPALGKSLLICKRTVHGYQVIGLPGQPRVKVGECRQNMCRYS